MFSIFTCAYLPSLHLLWWKSVQSLAHCGFFSLLLILSYLSIQGIPFYSYLIYKHFLSDCRFPLHSINHVFLRTEVFVFRSLIHPVFSFMDWHSIFKKNFFFALFLKIRFYSFQTGLRKGRGTRDQLANICWIMEKAREFQKKHLFLLYWLY